MFERISYTWSLMGASWGVLKRDKELLLFPLMSFICCAIVMLSFALPLYRSDFLAPPPADAETARHIVYYGILFLFYLCNYFVIIFFNAGIVACAVKRLEGGDPTVSYGLRAAVGRLPLILGWALVSATVGVALRMLEDRSKAVGRIVAAILGTAWSVMTFLVVPILVVEKKGPLAAAGQSAKMLKSTWGEQIIGGFSFVVLFFLLALPGFLLVGAAIFVHWVLLVPGIVYLLVLALVQSALQVVFQAAVYLYAREGQAPAEFGTGLLDAAMRTR